MPTSQGPPDPAGGSAKATGGLTGLSPGEPGHEALWREIDRANRTGAALSVAFVAVLGSDDGRCSTVAAALLGRLRSYDVVIYSADGEAIVCALPGVRSRVARVRMEAIRLDLAESGIAVEVGHAELVDGDTPTALIDRAGAAI